jgi:predicted kinase
MSVPATLIIFSGLPAAGKTTLARILATQLDALYLRIDTIEQSLRDSRRLAGSVEDAGYCVAYAVAADNLRLGRTVVADSVNPLQITREAWRAVAAGAGAMAIDVEVICSNIAEHRQRVESRPTDIAGLVPPSWQEISEREYHPWDRDHIIIDTANTSVEEAIRALMPLITSAASTR